MKPLLLTTLISAIVLMAGMSIFWIFDLMTLDDLQRRTLQTVAALGIFMVAGVASLWVFKFVNKK